VALARAVASRAPVVVLDDPFASLDPVVAARVLRSAICDALGGSTRIVASNFPPLLRTANRVFVVANGCVVEAAVDDAMLQSLSPPPVSAIPSSPPPPPPVPSPSAAGSQGGAEETPGVEMKGGGLYAAYVRRGGGAVFVVASLVVLLNAAMVGADLILTNWSNFKEPLIFYGVSCAAVVLLSFLLSIAWLWAGLRVANAIHKSLARKVIYARASFLSRTSMGYLINRFVSDIPTLDVYSPPHTPPLTPVAPFRLASLPTSPKFPASFSPSA
jgi:ABC-type multidrug transport system fused ATPase/permease subunit